MCYRILRQGIKTVRSWVRKWNVCGPVTFVAYNFKTSYVRLFYIEQIDAALTL
jgi:hypothetical protein